MVSTGYLSGRTKWYRPQAMIWSDKPFVLVDGGYVPTDDMEEGETFVVVTDHARSEIDLSPERIEARTRMINGTSRSHFTADKLTLSTSWDLLPSRIASEPIAFDKVTGAKIGGGCAYVADDASAAMDLIEWHKTHPGNFWVYMSYDLGSETDTLTKYSDKRLMYFASFSKTLVKRGAYDMWNIGITLGEV